MYHHLKKRKKEKEKEKSFVRYDMVVWNYWLM